MLKHLSESDLKTSGKYVDLNFCGIPKMSIAKIRGPKKNQKNISHGGRKKSGKIRGSLKILKNAGV